MTGHPNDYTLFTGGHQFPVSGTSRETAIRNAKTRIVELGLPTTKDTHLRNYDGWTVWEAQADG